MDEQNHYLGFIKWFDQEKDFGVVSTIKNKEVFLHSSAIIERFSFLGGEAVVFESAYNQKKERNEAKQCRLANKVEDLKLLWEIFGLEDSIIFEKSSNIPFGKRQKFKANLRGKTVLQIVNIIGIEEFIKFIKKTFQEAPTNTFFNHYCSLLSGVIKTKKKENASDYLTDLYSFFYENRTEEIVFQVWKLKTYERLNLTGPENLSLSQEFFEKNLEAISADDLKRLQEIEFYEALKEKFVAFQLDKLDKNSISQLGKVFELLLELTPEKEDQITKRFIQVYIDYSDKNINRILEEDKSAEYRLRNLIDFLKYNLTGIPKTIFKEVEIYAYSKVQNSTDSDLRIIFWLNDLIEKPIKDELFSFLLDNSKTSDEKPKVFAKLELEERFQFLKASSEKIGAENTYSFLVKYIEKDNYRINYSKPSDFLLNRDYWTEVRLSEDVQFLLQKFHDFIEETVDQEAKDFLYTKDYYPTVSESYVENHLDSFSDSLIRKIFIDYKHSPSSIKKWFSIVRKSGKIDLKWLLSIISSVLDEDNFNQVDQDLIKDLNESEYFELWKSGYLKITPKDQIRKTLNEGKESFDELISKVRYNSSSKRGTIEVLLKLLEEQSEFTSYNEFLFITNCFHAILELDSEQGAAIEKLQIPFCNLLLWFYNDFDTFSLDSLNQKFIYFNPEDQSLLFKKLFFEKANSKIEITLKDIKEINRFDLELYKTHLLHHKDVPIDISTDLVIQILDSLESKNEIITESDILSLVLTDLKFNKTKRFKFEKYFEECSGRMIGEYDWKNTQGKIRKIPFGQNQFYYSISFPRMLIQDYGREVWNPLFNHLVEAVKKLPGRKWNPEEEHWGVPSKYEAEVMGFAKLQRFYLDFEGSNYKNNPHLVEYSRDKVPDGANFCEGRPANKPDSYLNKNFFWCGGDKCYQRCEQIHSPEEWLNYKLLDFCRILGFNLDETSRMGDFIPDGIYYRFISLVNRFNRMLERLYCEECNEILHPVETSHFASRTVVRFHCVNNNCSCKGKEVYLNHCLNGKCNSIIDSRRSKKCPHELFICEKCGSCCSHSQMSRRLSSLEEVGGYIHPQLRRIVSEKLGHLERGDYFCFKCGEEMEEIEEELFRCNSCEVTYNTKKYNFKREHKHLKTSN